LRGARVGDIAIRKTKKNGPQKGKFLLGTFLSERKVPSRGGGRDLLKEHIRLRMCDLRFSIG
jgi:hypothetical protein